MTLLDAIVEVSAGVRRREATRAVHRPGDHQRRRIHEPKRAGRHSRRPRGWGHPHAIVVGELELREHRGARARALCSMKALAKPAGST